jgi:hypothetical protein
VAAATGVASRFLDGTSISPERRCNSASSTACARSLKKIVTAVITPQQGEASSNTSNTKHMNLGSNLYKFEL